MQSGSGTGKVVVDIGECDLCATFAGEAVVGTDPLPPFHPSCTCTAARPYRRRHYIATTSAVRGQPGPLAYAVQVSGNPHG